MNLERGFLCRISGKIPGAPKIFSHAFFCTAVLKCTAKKASLELMNPAAYRDLERILGRTLNAFSATRQKLDPYERRMRDRLAIMLLDVARARNRREREKSLVARAR